MKSAKKLTFWGALSCLLLSVSTIQADVKLPAIIGDDMVLQLDQMLPFWGTADPGETVTVTIGSGGGQIVSGTTTDSDGNNSIKLKNVLVGEVWVCSGQSNMAMPVSRVNDAEKEIDAAYKPKIRLFKAKLTVAGTPQADTEGAWVECSPKTVGGFTAVGYFFGRELHKRHGKPIGLIQTAWGGTPAEAWTSAETLKSDKDCKPILDRWDGILNNQAQLRQQFQACLAKWKETAARAKEAGKKAPRRPRPPQGPNHPHRASGLYNGMIAPLIPYAIKGAIWYQGESNASRAYQYRKLFRAMIVDWRQNWKQGHFPFLFVQLANFRQRTDETGDSVWAELREAQSMTLSLPNTGQAVIIDIGEANDIHPKNKQDVGYRLALNAEAIAYGKDLVYSGPVYKSMKIDGSKVRLQFNSAGGGLVAKGDGLKGFALAGKDRKFVWATANFEGDAIVLTAEGVANPVAVRYGWANNPLCNLYNKDGLPASPFRTDTWPGVTVKNKWQFSHRDARPRYSYIGEAIAAAM